MQSTQGSLALVERHAALDQSPFQPVGLEFPPAPGPREEPALVADRLEVDDEGAA
jgi:hypothetical protein